MFGLYEVVKCLSVKDSDSSEQSIVNYAWREAGEVNFLALVASTGDIILRYCCSGHDPVISHIPWPESRSIVCLCFDPTVSWLLVISEDVTVSIVPVLSLMDSTAKVNRLWNLEDVTVLRFKRQQGIPSVVTWWHTLDDRQIAIIGMKNGNILLVDLSTRKMVHQFTLETRIHKLELVEDDQQMSTYLMITGQPLVQWKLLLECRTQELAMPVDKEISDMGYDGLSGRSLPILSITQVTEETRGLFQPQKLDQFPRSVILQPQCAKGHHFITSHCSKESTFQVYDSNIDRSPLFAYKLPIGSDIVILTDKVLLAMTRLASGKKLYIIANQRAETSMDQTKDFNKDAVLQQFDIPQNEHLLTIQKKSFPFYWHEKCEENMRQKYNQDIKLGLTSSGSWQPGLTMSHDIQLTNHTVLDGCIIITDSSVYEMKPRISPERLFLELTFYSESAHVENLGIGLGLDVNTLYEKSAEYLLQRGHVAQAIKFCKVVKSTSYKLVMYLAKYGYVADAISHLTLALSNREISTADRKHVSNLYLHCMVYQLQDGDMETNQKTLINVLVTDFYYEEKQALDLLAEHNLCEALLELAMARGLVLEALEILVQKGHIVLEPCLISKLIEKGFAHHLIRASNGVLLDGLTPNSLVVLFCEKPILAFHNYTKLVPYIEDIETPVLEKLCEIFDPSQSYFGSHLGRQLLHSRKRRGSVSSMTSISSEGDTYTEQMETFPDISELIGFFFTLVLHLNKRLDSPTAEDLIMMKPKAVVKKARKSDIKLRKRKLKYQMKLVSCGAQHVGVVRNGDLYTWGRASHGRLGQGDLVPDNPTLVPCRVDTLHQLQIKVISVSCGGDHTVALTHQGVYSWGSSLYGQVGVGTRHMYSRAMLVNFGHHIISVVCGLFHTLALTNDNQVYSWGWGVHGQLGHGDPEDQLTPKRIETLSDKQITAVSGGYCHTLALSSQGEIWVFGCGYFGQLGIGHTTKQSLPVKMERIPHKVKMIATKYFHNVAVTIHNVVYNWGCHPYNLRLNAHAVRRARQAGTAVSDPVERFLVPEIVDTSFVHGRIVKASCGKSHTCLVTLDGDVYTWGRNMDGQIGNNSRQDVKTPSMVTSINDKQIIHISSGGEFNVAMDSEYSLWVWGKNEFGQLGLDPTDPGRRLRPSSNMKEQLVPTRCTALPSVKPLQSRHLMLSRSRSSSSDDELLLSDDDDFVPHIPDLQSDVGVKYSRCVVLTILEHLPSVCNCLKLLRTYVDHQDWLSAAYICLHQTNYSQALSFHLAALTHYKSSLDSRFTEVSKTVIQNYIRLCVDHKSSATEKEEVYRILLLQIMKFWETHSLQTSDLEDVLQTHKDCFACDLCTTLFWLKTGESSIEITNEFRLSFSMRFKFKILETVIHAISDTEFERRHPALYLMLSSLTIKQNASSLSNLNPFNQLWHDVVQNLQKEHTNYIYITRGELDHLDENLHMSRRSSSSEPNAVVFTCGHNYTRQIFIEEIMTKFEKEITDGHTKLERCGSILMQYYQRPGMLCVACPKCVVNALHN
ncbi:uncharacterized protein LOC127728604 isoform X1 [Mytilus californianus]|uniref:uncharacterized protein LOC127728604 isoform X1 n=1 Tax=Mytilus californianus TaxID=6549 RepID=UPI002247EAA3|nr:uncharacterized protein LOC127728604 isoform X1 [Mytilus californianus]